MENKKASIDRDRILEILKNLHNEAADDPHYNAQECEGYITALQDVRMKLDLWED